MLQTDYDAGSRFKKMCARLSRAICIIIIILITVNCTKGFYNKRKSQLIASEVINYLHTCGSA